MRDGGALSWIEATAGEIEASFTISPGAEMAQLRVV